MRTSWDYTELAEAYLKRPDYAPSALEDVFRLMGASSGMRACDIGAGTGHLTRHLARSGFEVVAVEPNDAMRRLGLEQMAGWPNVRWIEAVAEDTGLPDASFDLVTFGSSFNVTDRLAALRETNRLLKAGGWFVCLWNHRDLDDPVQAAIQAAIAAHVPDYSHGTRREDQTEVIQASGLFEETRRIEGRVEHQVSVEDCREAWRSHATLKRQAGAAFEDIVRGIDDVLDALGATVLTVPYSTRVWAARKKDGTGN